MARDAPSIDAYGEGGFRLSRDQVAGERHDGSLLIVADQAQPWAVSAFADLTVESLAPVFAAGRAEVEFLLLGVGARSYPQGEQTRDHNRCEGHRSWNAWTAKTMDGQRANG